MMRGKWSIGLQAATLVLTCATTGFAQGQSKTNQGSLPSGKPFQQIQSQFAEVDQQLAALRTQITAVESGLQAQINDIYGTLGDQQGQIDGLQRQINSVAEGVAALEEQVADNGAAITALKAAVESLQTSLAQAHAAIAAGAGDVAALQNEVRNIQTLIVGHQSQITGLEEANREVERFLANMANATCQSGEAIEDIGAGGIIQCVQTAGNLASATVAASGWLYPNEIKNLSVGCPAGYELTGSGYYVQAGFDYVQQVTGVGHYLHSMGYRNIYTWPWPGDHQWEALHDWVTIPVAQFRNSLYNPVAVTRSTPGTTASTQMQYAPTNYLYPRQFAVYASCVRLQP